MGLIGGVVLFTLINCKVREPSIFTGWESVFLVNRFPHGCRMCKNIQYFCIFNHWLGAGR